MDVHGPLMGPVGLKLDVHPLIAHGLSLIARENDMVPRCQEVFRCTEFGQAADNGRIYTISLAYRTRPGKVCENHKWIQVGA